MQTTTIPNRASDAGPDNQPMDLTDWIFEADWRVEQANKAHKRDSVNPSVNTKAAVRLHLEAAKEAIDRALEVL